MSNYSKMQAPPFWQWMFRIAGVLCLVTLVTPAGYFVKYIVFDAPREADVSHHTSMPVLANQRPNPDDVAVYISAARRSPYPAIRTKAIGKLGDLIKLPGEQILRPIECLKAKIALGDLTNSDPDPTVRAFAQKTLLSVAAKGAVIER